MIGRARVGRRASSSGSALANGPVQAVRRGRLHAAEQRARRRSTRTVVVALLVGIIVTLLASLRPALRATRVPPIAAVREGATLPPRPLRALPAARPRSAPTLLGFAALVYGLFGAGLGTTGILALDGPRRAAHLRRRRAAVSRSSCGRSRPCSAGRRARLGGVAGTLARENAQRNPQRTASTASALMIGLALVTLVAVLAAGITSSFRGAVDNIWNADYAITAQNNFSPIPIRRRRRGREVPGVTAVANVRAGDAKVFGNVDAGDGRQPGRRRRSSSSTGRRGRSRCSRRSGADGVVRRQELREGPPPRRRLAGRRS